MFTIPVFSVDYVHESFMSYDVDDVSTCISQKRGIFVRLTVMNMRKNTWLRVLRSDVRIFLALHSLLNSLLMSIRFFDN